MKLTVAVIDGFLSSVTYTLKEAEGISQQEIRGLSRIKSRKHRATSITT
jgi:hypothetical protein